MAEIERRLAAKGCIRAYLLVLPMNGRLVGYYSAPRVGGDGDHDHGQEPG